MSAEGSRWRYCFILTEEDEAALKNPPKGKERKIAWQQFQDISLTFPHAQTVVAVTSAIDNVRIKRGPGQPKVGVQNFSF